MLIFSMKLKQIFYTHFFVADTLVISRWICGSQSIFLEFSKELISYFSVTSGLESVYHFLSYQMC